MSMRVTPGDTPTPPPDPSTTASYSPISKQALRDLADKELILSDSKVRVKGEVKEVNGSYTFKVGNEYKTYTITVGKDVLASLTTDDNKRAWSKGLSLQLANMYNYGSLRTSFNLVDRSITINERTYYFQTHEQVQKHKEDYAKLRGDLPDLQTSLNKQADELGKTAEELSTQKKDRVKDHWYSKSRPKNETKVVALETKLDTQKGERAPLNTEKSRIERQIRVMEQLHLMAGQLFIEGGLAHDHLLPPSAASTTITDASTVPELPLMGSRPGPGGIAAATTPVPPSSFKRIEDLESALLEEKPATKESPITINDGMTPRVVDLLTTANEFAKPPEPTNPPNPSNRDFSLLNLRPIEEIKAMRLKREELWALLKGVRDIQKQLFNEEMTLATPKERKEEIHDTLIPQLETYASEIRELKNELDQAEREARRNKL